MSKNVIIQSCCKPILQTLLWLLLVTALTGCMSIGGSAYTDQKRLAVRKDRSGVLRVGPVKFLPPYVHENRSEWRALKESQARNFNLLPGNLTELTTTATVEFIAITTESPPRTKVAWVAVYQVEPAAETKEQLLGLLESSKALVVPPGTVDVAPVVEREAVVLNSLDCLELRGLYQLRGSPRYKDTKFSYYSDSFWCPFASSQGWDRVAEITFSERLPEGATRVSQGWERERFLSSLHVVDPDAS